jgi:hypothetical protein
MSENHEHAESTPPRRSKWYNTRSARIVFALTAVALLTLAGFEAARSGRINYFDIFLGVMVLILLVTPALLGEKERDADG